MNLVPRVEMIHPIFLINSIERDIADLTKVSAILEIRSTNNV